MSRTIQTFAERKRRAQAAMPPVPWLEERDAPFERAEVVDAPRWQLEDVRAWTRRRRRALGAVMAVAAAWSTVLLLVWGFPHIDPAGTAPLAYGLPAWWTIDAGLRPLAFAGSCMSSAVATVYLGAVAVRLWSNLTPRTKCCWCGQRTAGCTAPRCHECGKFPNSHRNPFAVV